MTWASERCAEMRSPGLADLVRHCCASMTSMACAAVPPLPPLTRAFATRKNAVNISEWVELAVDEEFDELRDKIVTRFYFWEGNPSEIIAAPALFALGLLLAVAGLILCCCRCAPQRCCKPRREWYTQRQKRWPLFGLLLVMVGMCVATYFGTQGVEEVVTSVSVLSCGAYRAVESSMGLVSEVLHPLSKINNSVYELNVLVDTAADQLDDASDFLATARFSTASLRKNLTMLPSSLVALPEAAALSEAQRQQLVNATRERMEAPLRDCDSALDAAADSASQIERATQTLDELRPELADVQRAIQDALFFSDDPIAQANASLQADFREALRSIGDVTVIIESDVYAHRKYAGFALFMGMVVSAAFCLVGVCLLFRYYRKKRSLVRAGVHFTGCGWVCGWFFASLSLILAGVFAGLLFTSNTSCDAAVQLDAFIGGDEQALPFLSSKCVEARAETTGVDPCGLVRGCVRSPDTPLMANLLDMANASLPDVDAAEARADSLLRIANSVGSELLALNSSLASGIESRVREINASLLGVTQPADLAAAVDQLLRRLDPLAAAVAAAVSPLEQTARALQETAEQARAPLDDATARWRGLRLVGDCSFLAEARDQLLQGTCEGTTSGLRQLVACLAVAAICVCCWAVCAICLQIRVGGVGTSLVRRSSLLSDADGWAIAEDRSATSGSKILPSASAEPSASEPPHRQGGRQASAAVTPVLSPVDIPVAKGVPVE